MTPEQILADYERMLDAEIDEATEKWLKNNHTWQRHWDYMLGVRQAKDLLKLAKLGPPVIKQPTIEDFENMLVDSVDQMTKEEVEAELLSLGIDTAPMIAKLKAKMEELKAKETE